MVVTTPAFVFSKIKYGDADLIVTCFTKSDGVKTYLLRGVLKSKKGKLRAALFQPLTYLDLEAFHKNKGTLERIKEAKVGIPYQSLHTDVVKGSLVLFLAEVLQYAIQEEEANDPLFSFLTQSVIWLDSNNDHIADFHILFLLKLTTYLGFYPDASNSDLPYFNLVEGNFQGTPFGDKVQRKETITAFKLFFGINFDALSQIKLSKVVRLEVLNLLLLYYQLHLQGFKKPKSLEVLQQLYNH